MDFLPWCLIWKATRFFSSEQFSEMAVVLSPTTSPRKSTKAGLSQLVVRSLAMVASTWRESITAQAGLTGTRTCPRILPTPELWQHTTTTTTDVLDDSEKCCENIFLILKFINPRTIPGFSLRDYFFASQSPWCVKGLEWKGQDE